MCCGTGLDPDTKEPTVGLKVDNHSDFAISAEPGDEFKQFPDAMKKVAKVSSKYFSFLLTK